jgi:prolyl 4-hydroxylase
MTLTAAEESTTLECLDRAASGGDPRAMTALGKRLLSGADVPVDVRGGAAWIVAAAERDEPAALCLHATLLAMGALALPDWPAALARLERAAIVGSSEARAQFGLLTDDTSSRAREPQVWKGVAKQVDLEAWRSAPARRPLWEAPRVRLAEGFVSPAACDWLRGRAAGRMRPAMMYHADMKAEVIDPHRTCSDYQFDLINTDLVLLLVRERIAALTKLPTIAMEPPRVFHYALGERIKPHFDRCNDGGDGYGVDTGYLGDRIVTLLLYLNDDFDGGELDFPKTGFRCRGAKGDAVYFSHVDHTGKPDALSLHAGLEITRGEKWVLSQWIHDRPFGAPERTRGRAG